MMEGKGTVYLLMSFRWILSRPPGIFSTKRERKTNNEIVDTKPPKKVFIGCLVMEQLPAPSGSVIWFANKSDFMILLREQEVYVGS